MGVGAPGVREEIATARIRASFATRTHVPLRSSIACLSFVAMPPSADIGMLIQHKGRSDSTP